jgi:hypothetical protein
MQNATKNPYSIHPNVQYEKKNFGQINLASHSEDDNNMNMQSIVEKGKHIHMVVVTFSLEYLMENL